MNTGTLTYLAALALGAAVLVGLDEHFVLQVVHALVGG
jgi:hypothetical protein